MRTCFFIRKEHTFFTKIKRWEDYWSNSQIRILLEDFLGREWWVIVTNTGMIPSYNEMCAAKIFPHNCVMYRLSKIIPYFSENSNLSMIRMHLLSNRL